MRGRVLAVVAVAAVLLALALGLGGSPRAAVRTPGAFGPQDAPEAPRGFTPATIGEQVYTVWSGSVTLDATANTRTVSLEMPDRTIQVLVNVTFVSGVSREFGFSGLSECAKRIVGPVVGDGTRISFDCGNVTAGPHDVLFSQGAGHFTANVEIAARVCPHGASCAYLPRSA